MNPVLAQLDSLLSSIRPDYYQRLQPGATAEQISAAETQLGVTLPPLVREFYAWKNGQAAGDYTPWQNNQTLMSLQAIVEAHAVLQELRDGGDFDSADWWRPGWIPLLDNGGGDHLCLDLEGSFGGQAGQLIEFRHDDELRRVVAPGFEDWLQSYMRLLGSVGQPGTIGDEAEFDWETDIPGYPQDHSAAD